ncbi:MAG: integrin alpha [Planctomycetota bacterium]
MHRATHSFPGAPLGIGFLLTLGLPLAAAGSQPAQGAPAPCADGFSKVSDTQGDFSAGLDDEDWFGRAVAPLGDLDGDGVDDLIATAVRDDDGAGDAGCAYVLFMNPDSTVAASQKISATSGGFGGPLAANDYFGQSVASLGDVDGDGVVDVAVGAMGVDDGGVDRGAVWILLLNADGTVRAETKISDLQDLDDGDRFGVSVAGLGDLDGDGVPDVAVGAQYDDDGGTDRGAVRILFLNPDGTLKALTKISDVQGGATPQLDDGDWFGRALAALGDVDGDGVGELAVGAHSDDDGGADRGAAWILFLAADGTVRATGKISALAGGFLGVLDDGDYFGGALSALGDLDGNGVPDLAVAAAYDDDGGPDRGAVWVCYLLPSGAVLGHQKLSDFSSPCHGGLDDVDFFGSSIASPVDRDGDGVPELPVGAIWDDDGGSNRGAVWVHPLAPAGCSVRNGSLGINPIDCACATLPLLGAGWETTIAVGPFTAVTGLMVSYGGPLEGTTLFGWELLVAPVPGVPVLGIPVGTQMVVIPNVAGLVGVELSVQGYRIDIPPGASSDVTLTNALDIRIGG